MEPQAINKREAILQASLALIMENGLNELTTAKIARKVGTAENTLYRHFASKHEIITELLQRVAADFYQKSQSSASSTTTPIDKLARLSVFHLDFMQQTKGVSRVIFSEQVHLASAKDPFKSAARALAHDYRDCIVQVIEEGKTTGYFSRELNADVASMSFIGLHYLLLHEWALDDYSWHLPDKQTMIVDHFCKVWGKSPP